MTRRCEVRERGRGGAQAVGWKWSHWQENVFLTLRGRRW
jgi:hypothetical protein